MTHYEAGRRAEYRAKAELEKRGMTVLRMSGSHGFADLVGVCPLSQEIKFIQVKVTSSKSSSYAKALDELAMLTPKGGWRVSGELWVWRRGGSSWTVEVA